MELDCKKLGIDAMRRVTLEVDIPAVQKGALGFGNWRLIAFGFLIRLAARNYEIWN